MGQFNWNSDTNYQSISYDRSAISVDVQPLMRMVYLWMVVGLLTTAGISYIVASSFDNVRAVMPFAMPALIVEFIIVMALSWGISKMSPTVAGFLFLVYSAINGAVFGIIFFAYVAQGQGMAITNAALTTAGLFGAMTVVGYTTKVDLSKFSTFLMMAMIGLVIAMIVNMFLGSSMLDLIISVIGVLVFTGLTAWDTQRIKEMAEQPEYSTHNGDTAKLAIMGALKLYLDFINIFLFLLRLFGGGGRRD